MKKNLKVIQINGFRGILCALGILLCLIAGFIVFPGYLLMNTWNILVSKYFAIQSLGLVQGVLLWGILVVSYMIVKKHRVFISFSNPTQLSDEELDEVMNRIKYETAAKAMKEIITKTKMDNKSNVVNMDTSVDGTFEQDNAVNKNIDN